MLKKSPFILKNFPNPFNPQTTIRYTLPAGAQFYDVTIKIYDMLGRLVMVLVKDRQSPGTYSIAWNGKDVNGIALPSGVYLYTLKAGSYTETKKMILIK